MCDKRMEVLFTKSGSQLHSSTVQKPISEPAIAIPDGAVRNTEVSSGLSNIQGTSLFLGAILSDCTVDPPVINNSTASNEGEQSGIA